MKKTLIILTIKETAKEPKSSEHSIKTKYLIRPIKHYHSTKKYCYDKEFRVNIMWINSNYIFFEKNADNAASLPSRILRFIKFFKKIISNICLQMFSHILMQVCLYIVAVMLK